MNLESRSALMRGSSTVLAPELAPAAPSLEQEPAALFRQMTDAPGSATLSGMPTAIKRQIFSHFDAVQLAGARLIACWANWLYDRLRLEVEVFRLTPAHKLCFIDQGLVTSSRQASWPKCAPQRHATSMTVAHVLGNFPGLTSLELSQCDKLDHLDVVFGSNCGPATNLAQITTVGPKLVTLDLRDCISLRSLGRALLSCPALRVLRLSGCRTLQNDGLEFKVNGQIGSSNSGQHKSGQRSGHRPAMPATHAGTRTSLPPTLLELDLSHCSMFTTTRALGGCRELQRLDLSWCSALTDLTGLSGCVSLRTLDLRWCHKLTSTNNLRIAGPYGSGHLAQVNGQALGPGGLGPSGVGTAGVGAPTGAFIGHSGYPSGCPSLTELNLADCRELVDVGGLDGCGSLTQLNLSRCYKLEETKGLVWLVTHSALATLHMSHCKALHSLASITADKQHHIPEEALEASEAFEASNQRCTNPRDQAHGTLSSKQQEAFADSVNLSRASLTAIDLSDCEKLVNIQDLATCSSLKTLNLAWSCTLADVTPLAKCAQLTALNLSWCNSLTDVSALSECGTLASLALRDCAGLRQITTLPLSLTTLNLSGCKSLGWISCFEVLSNVKDLDLRACPLLSLCLLVQIQDSAINEQSLFRHFLATNSSLCNCKAGQDSDSAPPGPIAKGGQKAAAQVAGQKPAAYLKPVQCTCHSGRGRVMVRPAEIPRSLADTGPRGGHSTVSTAAAATGAGHAGGDQDLPALHGFVNFSNEEDLTKALSHDSNDGSGGGLSSGPEDLSLFIMAKHRLLDYISSARVPSGKLLY